jgi:hypothetical protein
MKQDQGRGKGRISPFVFLFTTASLLAIIALKRSGDEVEGGAPFEPLVNPTSSNVITFDQTQLVMRTIHDVMREKLNSKGISQKLKSGIGIIISDLERDGMNEDHEVDIYQQDVQSRGCAPHEVLKWFVKDHSMRGMKEMGLLKEDGSFSEELDNLLENVADLTLARTKSGLGLGEPSTSVSSQECWQGVDHKNRPPRGGNLHAPADDRFKDYPGGKKAMHGDNRHGGGRQNHR